MKGEKFIVSILMATSVLLSCRVYKDVSVDCDSITDFTKYKTFAWVHDVADTANSPYNNEIIRNNLRNYFGKEFSERGFKVDLEQPDALFRLVIVNNPKTLNVLHPPFPFYLYYSSYYYKSDYYSPYPFNYYYHNNQVKCDPQGYCTEKFHYMEGSITFQMIDREQNKLIWSCTAKGDIYDITFINRSIHPAVKDIMKKFPVKPIDAKNTKQVVNVISAK